MDQRRHNGVRRARNLSRYDDIVAEVQRLAANGYTPTGKWNLSQICEHLNQLMRRSLDGFPEKVPWIIRVTVGRYYRNQWIAKRNFAAGLPTLKPFLPTCTPDDPAPIAELGRIIDRLNTATSLHPSPFLGRLSLDEWRTLHCVHAAHHLSFLTPKN